MTRLLRHASAAGQRSMSENEDILREARKAFSNAADVENDNRKVYIDDIKFARDGEQWHQDDINRRKLDKRPCMTINKMPAFIRQVVNDARQNKPAIHVHPADSGADKDTAEVINGLIRNIEYTSNADVAYDTATECAVTGGFGYFRIGLDYAYEDSFDMDLSIQRILNPLSVYGDPNSTAADSSDWDVAFVTDRLSKAQFKAKYGSKGKSAKEWDNIGDWSMDTEDTYDSEWRNEDTCLIAEYWTREEYDKPILQCIDLRSGQPFVTSKEDAEKDEDIQFLLGQGILQVKRERTSKCHKVKQRIMTGIEVLEENDWLGKYIPIVPVYGDEYFSQGKRRFRSLIFHAKDPQRQFNYWRTASTELVALAPRTPYVIAKGSIVDPEKWESANTQSHPYLEYDAKGGQIPPPARQMLDGGVAAGALQEALNSADDMKAVIGLFDASLGAKSNETSGKAIMARQREGDVSTFHFADNMSRAIRHAGRILIDLIPKVYNGARIIRVIGEDGTNKPVHINQQGPQTDKKGNPEVDEVGNAIMGMHDLTAGKYDLTVTTGPSFTTRREEAAFQMTEVIRAMPESAMVIAPELAKNLDWPGAEDIAEKMEAMASGQLPPEAQKQMEELGQKVKQLTDENQKLKMDNTADVIKAESQAKINEAKAQADIRVAEFKATKEIELKQATAAMEVNMTRDKLGADVEINREKVRGDHAIKLEQTDMMAADGERKKEADSAIKKAFERIEKRMDKQDDAIAELARIMAAPNELIRDAKGKATGSRKVLN